LWKARSAIIEQLKPEGNEQATEWLSNRLRQLPEMIVRSERMESDSTPAQATLQFLAGFLQLVAVSAANSEQIYSVLSANQARLSVGLLQALPVAFNLLLDESNSDQQSFIAGTFGKFADLIQQFPLGQRWLNLELAIQAYELAMQIRTRTNLPVDWAGMQNNLAHAYSNRIRGDRAENLELAIQTYEQVLQVFTRNNSPADWAMTQSNLALAYCDRIRGDRAENLEKAIQTCEQALQVHTRTDFPVQWAMTQNNLANAYRDRIRDDRAENLELAIQAYDFALQVRTHADFPVDWAMTQNNLALAYCDRIRGDRAENLNQAIASYHNALEIYQPEAFPLDGLRTSRSLGNLHFREFNWTAAVAAYELALQGLDQARQWAATDDRRQELQDEAASVYANLIQSYVRLESYGKALETVERSRSQRLVHLMASQDYYAQAGISPELQTLLTRYDSLQTQINQLQRPTLAQTRGRAALSAHSEEIHTLETQKQTLRQQISRLDPVSAGIIQVSPIDIATLQTLIPRSTSALLSFYITTTDTHIFILKQTQITCHTCPNQGDTLRNWLFETWLKPYAEINFADTEHDRRQRRQAWITQMPDILRELVDRLNLPKLIQTHLQDIDDLILVPHLLLHQIPFATLPLENGYLSDRFTLRQVPSTQILKFCHDRPPLQPTAYGTVEDATDDLPCSSFEGDQIAHLYNIPTTQRLRGSQQATITNYLKLLPQVQTLLSSHHAHSRLDNPLESSLQLGDGSITLGNLISPAIRLPNLADIFLSCCATGLSHNLGQSDEPLSLASGFLYAGARNVVSTLWAVDDLATSIFSICYHHHRQSHNRPIALKHAQTDLRTMTGTHLKQQYAIAINASLEERYERVYAEVKAAQAARDQCDRDSENYSQLEEAYEFWRTIQKRVDQAQQQLKQLCRADRPFAHPVYCSGFVCQGLE
jgi:CHAT domain-containing protein